MDKREVWLRHYTDITNTESCPYCEEGMMGFYSAYLFNIEDKEDDSLDSITPVCYCCYQQLNMKYRKTNYKYLDSLSLDELNFAGQYANISGEDKEDLIENLLTAHYSHGRLMRKILKEATISKLQDLCLNGFLPDTGSKEVLIDRLIDDRITCRNIADTFEFLIKKETVQPDTENPQAIITFLIEILKGESPRIAEVEKKLMEDTFPAVPITEPGKSSIAAPKAAPVEDLTKLNDGLDDDQEILTEFLTMKVKNT